MEAHGLVVVGASIFWDTNQKVKEALSRRPAEKTHPHGKRQGCIPLSISSVFPLFIFSILLVLLVSQTNRELYLNGFSIVLSWGFGFGFCFILFSCIFCQSNGKLEVCVAVSGWFCGDLAGCVPFSSCSS